MVAVERANMTGEQALTAREREFSALVAEGKTNRRIADPLCIGMSTVQARRLNLMKKLDLHDRTQPARHAIRAELIAPGGRASRSLEDVPEGSYVRLDS